jgi:hypothetical protein
LGTPSLKPLKPKAQSPKPIVRFSPDYVRIVLNENFEDAKAQFLLPLMAINYAHLVMLAEQAIVTRPEAAAIR